MCVFTGKVHNFQSFVLVIYQSHPIRDQKEHSLTFVTKQHSTNCKLWILPFDKIFYLLSIHFFQKKCEGFTVCSWDKLQMRFKKTPSNKLCTDKLFAHLYLQHYGWPLVLTETWLPKCYLVAVIKQHVVEASDYYYRKHRVTDAMAPSVLVNLSFVELASTKGCLKPELCRREHAFNTEGGFCCKLVQVKVEKYSACLFCVGFFLIRSKDAVHKKFGPKHNLAVLAINGIHLAKQLRAITFPPTHLEEDTVYAENE